MIRKKRVEKVLISGLLAVSLILGSAVTAAAEPEGNGESGGTGSEAGTVLYFVPHQDDEILTFAGGILEDLAAGFDVQVVLCTDGRSSTAFQKLREEDIALSLPGFIEERDKEFRDSLKALGVPDENIHIPEDRLVDRTVSYHEDRLREMMLRYIRAYPEARVCTETMLADHPDHAAIGQAAANLYREGEITSLRLYADSYDYTHDRSLPTLHTVMAEPDEEALARVAAACDVYQIYDPTNGRYAIGSYSVEERFFAVREDPTGYCYDLDGITTVRYGGSQRYETAAYAADGTAVGTADEDRVPNFKGVDVEIADGETVPDSDKVIVTATAITAPHNGRGTAPDSHGSRESAGGTLVIACGTNFPDALSASSLGCEIMLTKKDRLSPEAKAEILRTLPGRVIVIGASAAVSEDVFRAIRNIAASVTEDEKAAMTGLTAEEAAERTFVYQPTVLRCGGRNRYETAAAVAVLKETLGITSATQTAIVTTGLNFADAVSIAPYAAATGSPILLTGKGELNAASLSAILALGDNCRTVLIIGAEAVVPDCVRVTLEEAGKTVIRLAGSNRYETSAAVASYCVEEAGMAINGFYAAVGSNFPDALIAGPIAGNDNSVVLLCSAGASSLCTADLAASYRHTMAGERHFTIMGHYNVVTAATEERFIAALG